MSLPTKDLVREIQRRKAHELIELLRRQHKALTFRWRFKR